MVSSYVDLLGQRYKGQLDERADKYIRYAVDGAKRMAALIRDILDFSRVGTRGKEMTPTDTREVLEQALRSLRGAIRESNAVVECGELPTLTADAGQLEQVFQNLVGNALKFHGNERPQIRVSARQAGGEWIFTVADNGIGIPQEFHDKIFGVFQRLHSAVKYPGTGIGLAICKKIVERHGGRIRVDSEPGRGSSFRFTIPARGKEPPCT
jgi:light-regulated signal transduction histidine kinase (bacteriophytochrome)